MKWNQSKSPVRGDMVRVKAGSVYHYGIFVSEQEVVQFGAAPIARPMQKDDEITVCTADWSEFSCGGTAEVGEPEDSEKMRLRSPEQIVQAARNRIGEKGYHILYHNCEHFAYECAFGTPYSSQTERIRAMFRAYPILDVYVAVMPTEGEFFPLYPSERQQEIDRCHNVAVKREKYYVWKLLEYALYRTFGVRIESVEFTKSENGKWHCPVCEFSLSHSKNAVAVALSRKPTGVDIQYVRPMQGADGIARRIFSVAEQQEYQKTPPEQKNAFLIQKWTQKESIFKTLDAPGFLLSDPAHFSVPTHTDMLTFGKESYFLSVASECLENLRFYDSSSRFLSP